MLSVRVMVPMCEGWAAGRCERWERCWRVVMMRAGDADGWGWHGLHGMSLWNEVGWGVCGLELQVFWAVKELEN